MPKDIFPQSTCAHQPVFRSLAFVDIGVGLRLDRGVELTTFKVDDVY